MDDRKDRDTETTDRQITQTIAAVLLAYDRLVRRDGTSQDRARFVRFAALRLATGLRLITVTVDALIVAMLTRSRRQYVRVIPSTYESPVRRLESALETIIEDEPAPEVEDELEDDSDAEKETDESRDEEAPEVEPTDTPDDEDEPDAATTADESDAESDAEERREAKAERQRERERERERERQRKAQQKRDDRDDRERFKAELADELAKLASEQDDDDQGEPDYEDDEPESDEDRAILDEYRRHVERAAERQRSRIERLIQTEIKTRSREAFAEALGKRNMGGVWIARPQACPICQKLDGTIIEPGDDVPTSHPGCSCRIRPLLVINDPYVSTGANAA